MYGGRRKENLSEGDFDTSRAIEDHAGWKPYEYPLESVEDGFVAAEEGVVWETGVTRWIDNVRLE